MTNEQKSILSIRIVAAIMTVLLGIGIGYLIWHDKPVQIVNKVDKVKVDSLQNVINTLTLQLNNIKEYKVKEKIIYKTQIVKEKEKIYQALDTAARVNVFQKWVVDSSGIAIQTYTSQRYKHCDRTKTNGLPYITAIPISKHSRTSSDIQDRVLQQR
jgi:hypothetical protein